VVDAGPGAVSAAHMPIDAAKPRRPGRS